jgi:anti-anti-sigma regulatory factor
MAAKLSCLRKASISTVFLPASYRLLTQRRDTEAVTSKANGLEDSVVRAENLEVRTRDKVEIEIGALDRTDFLVKLSGDLDVHDLRTLHETLSLVLSTGLSTVVDLSDVTFLDVRCARELVVRSRLYDNLMLRAPSWQAEASFKVCGYEARVVHHLRRGSSREEPSQRVKARQEAHAGGEPRGTPALAM